MKKYKNIRTGLVFQCASPVRGADIVAIDDETPVVEEKAVEPKKVTKKNARKKPVCDSK